VLDAKPRPALVVVLRGPVIGVAEEVADERHRHPTADGGATSIVQLLAQPEPRRGGRAKVLDPDLPPKCVLREESSARHARDLEMLSEPFRP
jgi:hypothetical protein